MDTSSARATSASRATEILPFPPSRSDRNLGDTPDLSATSLKVQPILVRRDRTLLPICKSTGEWFMRPVVYCILTRPATGNIVRHSSFHLTSGGKNGKNVYRRGIRCFELRTDL